MIKKKLNMEQLQENLKLLEQELKVAGSPKIAIRRVRDIQVSIEWLQKHARVG